MLRIMFTDMQIVIEAAEVTPKMPEKTISASEAHHLAQIMAVVGRETFRYSNQPVKASLLTGERALLI